MKALSIYLRNPHHVLLDSEFIFYLEWNRANKRFEFALRGRYNDVVIQQLLLADIVREQRLRLPEGQQDAPESPACRRRYQRQHWSSG
jgi:hypothetical protein